MYVYLFRTTKSCKFISGAFTTVELSVNKLNHYKQLGDKYLSFVTGLLANLAEDSWNKFRLLIRGRIETEGTLDQ